MVRDFESSHMQSFEYDLYPAGAYVWILASHAGGTILRTSADCRRWDRVPGDVSWRILSVGPSGGLQSLLYSKEGKEASSTLTPATALLDSMASRSHRLSHLNSEPEETLSSLVAIEEHFGYSVLLFFFFSKTQINTIVS